MNLIELLKSYLTPDIIRNLALLLGEHTPKTQKAVNDIVPALFGGIAHLASTREGAQRLMDLLDDGHYPMSLIEDFPKTSQDEPKSRGLIKHGRLLLRELLGGQYRADTTVNTIAKDSGVRNFSCQSLTSLLAPLAMALLEKETKSRDVAGLMGLLTSQKAAIMALLPAGLASVLGLTAHIPASASILTSSLADNKKADDEDGRAVGGFLGGKWMLPLLFLGFVGLAAAYWRGCGTPEPIPAGTLSTEAPKPEAPKPVLPDSSAIKADTVKVEAVTLPSGETLQLAAGTINYELSKFLADKAGVPPKTFIFDNLNFTSGTTKLTPESEKTVNDLVDILKAYPNVEVALEGHTDNQGAAALNKRLSTNRAESVKARLVKDGIEAKRVVRAEGFGPDKPMADNTTEEGRAKNRRLELVVVKK